MTEKMRGWWSQNATTILTTLLGMMVTLAVSYMVVGQQVARHEVTIVSLLENDTEHKQSLKEFTVKQESNMEKLAAKLDVIAERVMYMSAQMDVEKEKGKRK